MPKNKNKKELSDSSSNSESDSGPEDRNPPAKKAKPDTSKRLKDSEGGFYWELDRQRRVSVREFKGKTLIDIREFYEKDGKFLPGKKGISLSVSQWNTLTSLIPEIDEGIHEVA